MKKGKVAGIGIAVITAAIVFGIASLPDDEVLLETPLDASENIPVDTFPTELQPEIISSEEQTMESEPQVESKPAPEEETETPEESEGNVIKIKINDGVGGRDK